MSTFNLGVVAPTHKGVYNVNTAYKARNIVSYNGGAYMAKQDCQGVNPENAEYWGLLAEAGQGTPIVYNGSFSSLQSDSVADKTKVYLISDENDTNYFGHIVFWNGSTWVDGGEYAGILDQSIELEKLNPNVYRNLGPYYIFGKEQPEIASNESLSIRMQLNKEILIGQQYKFSFVAYGISKITVGALSTFEVVFSKYDKDAILVEVTLTATSDILINYATIFNATCTRTCKNIKLCNFQFENQNPSITSITYKANNVSYTLKKDDVIDLLAQKKDLKELNKKNVNDYALKNFFGGKSKILSIGQYRVLSHILSYSIFDKIDSFNKGDTLRIRFHGKTTLQSNETTVLGGMLAGFVNGQTTYTTIFAPNKEVNKDGSFEIDMVCCGSNNIDKAALPYFNVLIFAGNNQKLDIEEWQKNDNYLLFDFPEIYYNDTLLDIEPTYNVASVFNSIKKLKVLQGCSFNSIMTGDELNSFLLNNDFSLQNRIDKPCNKTIICSGDSLTFGWNGYATNSYVDYVQDYYPECIVKNDGKSGKGTAWVANQLTNQMRDKYYPIVTDPDYKDICAIIINIGTNDGVSGSIETSIPQISKATDIEGNPLQFMTIDNAIAEGGFNYNGQNIATADDYWNLFVNDWYGNLALVIEYAQWKNPKTQLFLLPPCISTIEKESKFSAETIGNAMKELCDLYGIHFIDINHAIGINRRNAKKFCGDYVHGTNLRNEMVGKYVARYISDKIYDFDVEENEVLE